MVTICATCSNYENLRFAHTVCSVVSYTTDIELFITALHCLDADGVLLEVGTAVVCAVLEERQSANLLKPNDTHTHIYIYMYICRTAALTSRRYILNIYSTNIHTEYFKHAA